MRDDEVLIGGREKRAIFLRAWDPSWSTRFEQERQRISSALGRTAQRIEHIGSTSVSGLAAKPIIDIQLSVNDIEDEASYVGPMEEAGYVLRVREPVHRMLRTPDLEVHLHVCAARSDWERRHLLFRDWLRRSPDDRARYAAVKLQLAGRDWEDMNEYADAKNEVIREISRRAESWAAATGWCPEIVRMRPLGELDRQQRRAVVQLCRLFPIDRVNWALTGSAGHALQGVPVEVHDIDVQTDEPGAYAVAAALAVDALQPVRIVESGVMKSHFGRFRLHGIIVEVMGAVQTRPLGRDWLPPTNPADHRVLVPLDDEGLQVPVLSLRYEAEAYDRIGRPARAHLLRQHLG